MSGIMSHPSAGHAKVVFPPPPPTTNDLTLEERQQLVRKTKKIEQLLGTTPHFVDVGARPLSAIFSSSASPPRRRLTKRRSSIDSTCSTSSQESTSSYTPSLRRSLSVSSTESTSKVRPSARSDTVLDPISCDDDKVPFLRLTMSSSSAGNASRETRPVETAAVDTLTMSDVHPPRLSSITSASTNSVDTVADETLDDDTFHIPSSNSVRKQKMDRLRKKLGQDVPFELVFRDSNAPVPEPQAKIIGTIVKPTLPIDLPPTRTKKPSSRLSGARDSISDDSSIHRARRQTGSRRNASVPPRPTNPTASHISDLTRIAGRLSLIVESPDEQLGIPLNHDEPVPSHRASIRASDRTTEWLITIEAAAQGSYVSDSSLSTSASSISSSPMSEDSDSSPSPGRKSHRPLSYRKPVPPFLPVDVLC